MHCKCQCDDCRAEESRRDIADQTLRELVSLLVELAVIPDRKGRFETMSDFIQEAEITPIIGDLAR